MIVRAAVFVAAMLSASGAQADETVPLPDEYVSSEGRERFRLCRAAVLVETGAQEADRTALPLAVTKAMREQIDFIMSETIFGVPSMSIEDGAKRLAFTEKFVLDFGKTVGAEMERLADVEYRTNMLIRCQPLIWEIVKTRLDLLLQWRSRAMGLDAPFPVDDGLIEEK